MGYFLQLAIDVLKGYFTLGPKAESLKDSTNQITREPKIELVGFTLEPKVRYLPKYLHGNTICEFLH